MDDIDKVSQQERAIGENLDREILQAINRALSKTGGQVPLPTILGPLVVNTARVLVEWEEAGGASVDDLSQHVAGAVIILAAGMRAERGDKS